jgi:hypothetical protein
LDFKNFDWRSLQKYMSPKASGDLNAFLEKLPQTAGQTVLIAAAIAWTSAASIGLYAAVKTKELITLRAELKNVETLKPMVPAIKDVPVQAAELKNFADGMSAVYRGLSIKPQGAGLYITSTGTGNFGEFREAIGHAQNGGSGWRVTLDRLCVGRECDREKLAALLKVNTVSVDKPQ